MIDQLQMFAPEISRVTHNATFSLVSAAGQELCGLPDSLRIGKSGREAVLASRSQWPEKEKAQMTNATCGRSGSISSKSVSLQSSLESKLRQRLHMDGLMGCSLIWKTKITPALRQLSQLAVSVRRTDGSGCGLWPTATTRDWKGKRRKLDADAVNRSQTTGVSFGMDLNQAVELALWPTPRANDAEKRGAIANDPRNGLPQAALWATPNTMDFLPNRSKESLDRQFATTRKGRTAPANLREQVHPENFPASGNQPNGSSAQTENKGALNPAFVCWLMGFPQEWEDCAPTATPSSHKRRRNL